MIHYEDFERDRLDSIYDTIAPYSEMARNARYFLNGIIRYLKPKKLLEAGVSHGGSSAIILNAIRDIDGAKLYSVDYSEMAYKNKSKLSGWLVDEQFPELKDKWQIYRGGDVSCFIEDIGGDIDLFMLDTVHDHPWETLNFLCALPFMKRDSWCVLHDITRHFVVFRIGMACWYLFSYVVSDEKVYPVTDYPEIPAPANIGAFRVSEVTMKYVDNLFKNLLIPWGSVVPEKDIQSIKKVIQNHYSPEQYDFFCEALEFQKYLEDHPQKISFNTVLRAFAKSNFPRTYSVLRKIKRTIKKKEQ